PSTPQSDTLSLHDALPIFDAAKRSFTIDENWDFVDFAMELQDISGGNVRFETIPLTSIDSVTEWGESIVTADPDEVAEFVRIGRDRKSTRLNSSHVSISSA